MSRLRGKGVENLQSSGCRGGGSALIRLTLFASVLVSITDLYSPASASQSALQQQATSIANQITTDSSAVRSLVIQRGNIEGQINQLNVEIASSQASLTVEHGKVRKLESALTRAAINVYVGGFGLTSLGRLLSSTQQDYLLKLDFENLSSMSVSDTTQELRFLTLEINQQELVLDNQLVSLKSKLANLSTAQTSLANKVTAEQSVLAQVNGQIETLIQQALARKARQNTVQGLPTPGGIRTVVQSPPLNQNSSLASDLTKIRDCESGGNYSDNTGNGYYGAYQFSESTWLGLGFPGYPYQAPPSVQDQAAALLASRSGWGQWPACALLAGLIS